MSKRAAIEFFLLSIAALYVELLVIRWMSSDIRALTVFRTFPLITCYVGLGVGLALRNDKWLRYTPLAMLQFVLTMYIADVTHMAIIGFPSAQTFSWVKYDASESLLRLGFAMLAIIPLLAGLFAICVCIGSRLGVLFNQFRPLVAYSINLTGSLLGSALFAALSYLGIAPWYLMLIPGLMVAYFLLAESKANWRYAIPVLLVPLAFMFPPKFTFNPVTRSLPEIADIVSTTYWSPYQRLDLDTFTDKARHELIGLEVSVNRFYYQCFFNDKAYSLPNLPADLAEVLKTRKQEYSLPFVLNPTRDALIVGAGTGQNAMSAVAHGAQDVEAVDIDPVILQIGKTYNDVYNAPQVKLVCDDARHWFEQTTKKYDTIVFSLLDSHAVTGQGSSVRLDTYVYTQESFRKAISLLKQDGIMVVSFDVLTDYIGRRLYSTIKSVAGYEPVIMHTKGTDEIYFLVVGDKVRDGKLEIPEGFEKSSKFFGQSDRVLTDDWPYLYVQSNVVDIPYLLVIAEIVALSLFAGRKFLFGKSDPRYWQMFFLGSAFLLLELHAISFLSLLYGSTWLTSAIVINGILLMILASNLAVIKWVDVLKKNQNIVYLFLIGSILLSYFTPEAALVAAVPGIGGTLLVSFITLLPMCVAGIIFSTGFSQAADPAKALAFNLFGSVVGGLLEYVSVFTGIKSLELIAAGLYLLSWVCLTRVVGTTDVAEQEK